jgi:hypothetical protein
VCKLYGSGTHRCRDKKEHQFIAMEARARARARERPACCVAARLTAACAPQLVGTTLAELRKAREPQRFTRATTCAVRPTPARRRRSAGMADPSPHGCAQVGVRMLDALRALHSRGCGCCTACRATGAAPARRAAPARSADVSPRCAATSTAT